MYIRFRWKMGKSAIIE